MCMKTSGCCFIVFGGAMLILGISLLLLQETIMSYIGEKILNLNSDSYVYNVWRKYPFELPLKYTFFNWTNHKDFLNKSFKPKFEEIGPYFYLQAMERTNVVRNDNNDTITFNQLRTFRYDNNIPSNGNLSDELTTINYFAMIIGHIIKDWNSVIKDMFSEYLSVVDPYYYFNTTIDDQILKGSSNLLLELSNYFNFILPDFPRVDGFGWLKLRHGDPNFDGVFNMANGVNRQFEVLNWNYQGIVPYFNKSCAKVKGSMGDIYSFPLNKNFIVVFTPELCRYVKFYFEKEVVVDGIMGYKYAITKLSLDNGTLNEENKCFCVGNCMVPSGLLSESCRWNTNLFMSSPHYYNADTTYLNSFEGLNPDKHKHESYIIVEPKSLLCLKFRISAQLNVLTYPVEGISYFDDYPKLYFPLYWVEEEDQIPDEIRTYLIIFLKIPYVIYSISTVLIILGICLPIYAEYKFKKFHLLEKFQSRNQNLTVKLDEQIPLNNVIKK